jgi:uncharacterized membrane protein YedE/YeeE
MVAVGGLLVGSAAAAFLYLSGRVLGVSGLYGQLVTRAAEWRVSLAFVGGLIAGGALLKVTGVVAFEMGVARSLPVILLAGVLVGAGTRLASGCTSGHGICGVARVSRRSLAATGTFMLVGMLTVWITRQLGWL